jgi:hypothetical protein
MEIEGQNLSTLFPQFFHQIERIHSHSTNVRSSVMLQLKYFLNDLKSCSPTHEATHYFVRVIIIESMNVT